MLALLGESVMSFPGISLALWNGVGSSRASGMLLLLLLLPLPLTGTMGIDSSCPCFSVLAFMLLLRLRQRRHPISARAITPHGTATPAAIATVLELLVDAAEVARAGVEVADAAVVEAVAAGDGDPVAFAVEAATRS